ncbi:MAG: bifunctional adenosylcobinamide kinase/adenosylcobinamide-phosphate guanylyltransferase [Oscillospiraceae bacterium]|nr:bifunctional adenosylcobinamide kinase/adenosylcobinamide-phosphate guanylyltransferase [Oscillospiraceae bacterium]
MIILLTGGSGCGKSSYAEKIAVSIPGQRYYLAAMQPFGAGGAEKVARHRKMREGKGFETIERYRDYKSLCFPERGTALLECICNLTANEMFDENYNLLDPYEEVMKGIDNLEANCDNLIIITNDVGSDVQSGYSEETKAYVESIGRINREIAERADCVLELVAGIPILLKGEMPI